MGEHQQAPPVAQKRIPDPELLAVRPAAWGRKRFQFGEVQEPEDQGLRDAPKSALEQGGWILVKPSAETKAALAKDQLPPGAEEAQWAWITGEEDERGVVLGAWRCTVRVRGDSEKEAWASIRRLEARDLRVLRPLPGLEHTWSIQVPRHTQPHAYARQLLEKYGDQVAGARPEWLRASEVRYQPRGPLYHFQWQWRNRGQTGGTAGADVKAEQAWAITRGRGARIAVIDNGFVWEHADLSSVALPLSGRFSGSGSGVFQPGTASLPTAPTLAAHGTWCAAMAAARPRRRRGLTGMAPRARLTLIAVEPFFSCEMLYHAIRYAANPHTQQTDVSPLKGADVISCSISPAWDDLDRDGLADPQSVVDDCKDTLAKAFDDIEKNGRGGRGTVFTWAVSNSSGGMPKDFVAGVKSVVAVGMTTFNDTYGGHATGKELDLVAPGLSVLTAKPIASTTGRDWEEHSGTSMAAPLVAGVVALMLSVNPTFSARQIRKALKGTCDQVGGVPYAAGHHPEYGYGRVNAYEAVKLAAYPPP